MEKIILFIVNIVINITIVIIYYYNKN